MPRTGSSSIVKFCNENNITNYGGANMGFWAGEHDQYVNQNTHQRLYKCVMNYTGAKKYTNSYIFSSVRNPYSRAVSMFRHESWDSVKTFRGFCMAIKRHEYPSGCAKWHVSRITDHLVDADGELKVDYIIKLEDCQSGINKVCRSLDIKKQRLSHENQSGAERKKQTIDKHYTEYYNDVTRAIITDYFAQDIERFGYKFGE